MAPKPNLAPQGSGFRLERVLLPPYPKTPQPALEVNET